MKLWVDDLRPPPDGWTWAKTSDEAIRALSGADETGVKITDMSLDHDLGRQDTTRRVVLWLCEMNVSWPDRVFVHTANPVGREWLVGMVERYGPGVSCW